MRIKNFPDIDFPMVVVSASAARRRAGRDGDPGHPDGRGLGRGLQGIKHISSTVTDGVSITIIEFELGTDLEQRHQRRAQRRRAQSARDLPGDIREPHRPAHRLHRQRR